MERCYNCNDDSNNNNKYWKQSKAHAHAELWIQLSKDQKQAGILTMKSLLTINAKVCSWQNSGKMGELGKRWWVVGEMKSLFVDFRKVICCVRSRASFVSMYMYNRFYRIACERYTTLREHHIVYAIHAYR